MEPINLIAAYTLLESDTLVVVCRMTIAEFQSRQWRTGTISDAEVEMIKDMIDPPESEWVSGTGIVVSGNTVLGG